MRSGSHDDDLTLGTDAGSSRMEPWPAHDPTLHRRGEVIGRYLLVERLGRGGMGEVWSAYDPELDRKVALKLLLLETEAGRTRLLREAQALARLTHPNVVTIHDAGSEAAQVWIAMELIEGQTLRTWLRERPRSWRELRAIMLDAGRGLAAAHQKGLVHRDFKPENVMIGADGRVRVMDFGLVRSDESQAEPELEDLEPDPPSASQSAIPTRIIDTRDEISKPLDTDITRGGKIMGTPAYMAPEQHLGLSTDARTDQFGFCVTLWESLHRQRPFAGTSLATLALSVCEGKLSDPPRGSDVPAWLRRVAERGLAVNPDNRWPSMDALLEALARDPSRRAWFVVGGALILSLGVGAWAQSRYERGREIDACVAAGAQTEAVWNPEIKAALDQAFAATGAKAAADTWSRTEAILDDWTETWAELRTSSCISSPLESALIPASLDCFAEHEAALSQLLGALTSVDRDGLHHAVLSARALPLTASCVDPKRLRARAPTPKDPRQRVAVELLRADLSRAEALRALGRFDDALASTESSLSQARALGWRPTEAEALIALGVTQAELGDYVTAERLLEDGFMLAGEVGAEALMVRGGLELAQVVGDDQARHQEGLRWARLARIYVARAGLADEPIEADLDTVVGRIHSLAGDGKQAEAALLRAQANYERTLGPDHPKVAAALNNLGNLANDQAAYARGRPLLDQALDIYERALGPEHPKVAVVLNNLGNSHRATGEAEQSLALFQRSLRIREQAFGPTHPDVATALNNYGVGLLALGRDDEALPIYERALEIREATLGPEHPRVATTLNNLGRIYARRGDHERAEGLYTRALSIRSQALGADHPRVGLIMFNLAELYEDRGELERAKLQLRELIDLYERAHGPKDPRRLSGLRQLGRVERRLGHFDAAATILAEALELDRTQGDRQLSSVGLIEAELGALAHDRGYRDEALIHFESALSLLDQAETSDELQTLAQVRFAMAQLLRETEPERALALAEAAKADLANNPHASARQLDADIGAWLEPLSD